MTKLIERNILVTQPIVSQIGTFITDTVKETQPVEVNIYQYNNFDNIALSYSEGKVTRSKLTREGLIESVTQPSRRTIMTDKIDVLRNIYKILNYNNPVVLDIAADIIENCINQSKTDIKISRTGENEILIFRESNGNFKNIIIDEDGDVEFLYIPVNRSNTKNEHFSFINGYNAFELVSKL